LSLLSAAGCFIKGFVIGAAGTLLIYALAAAAALVLPVWAITGALFVMAVIGTVVMTFEAVSAVHLGNWDELSFLVGVLVGAILAGGAAGRAAAQAINGVESPPWSLGSDWGQRYNPDLGSIIEWLGTGFNPGSLAVAAGMASAGAGSQVAPGCAGGCG
jgi:hypothetical protein